MTRILIVEDAPVEQLLIQRLLGKALPNVELTICSSGQMAIESLSSLPTDLILVDQHLPDLTGIELIERLRPEHPHLPVILITGSGSERLAHLAFQAGAADYLSKRDISDYLVETVSRVLALVQATRRRQHILGALLEQQQTFRLQNDVELITPLIELIQSSLMTMTRCSVSECSRVGIAVHEAVTNAIYHGNLELDSELRQVDDSKFYLLGQQRAKLPPYCERLIEVSVVIGSSQIEITIRDDGPGFDVATALDKVREIDFERIGGRGLLMISNLMDEFHFNSRGNELQIIKRLTQPEPLPRTLTRGA
jgi:CheY-like chemotaxis protein/anti-sigma regulatory factor (Ser/Thr protein kinase)